MKQKKVGIVGCGHISDTHIKSWGHASNSKVTGLFDLNEELLNKKSKKYSIPIYSDLQDLINDCDILDVCTPPHTHLDICLQIIKSKKDFLVEKPLVTDTQDWEILKEEINKSNVKFAVCHNLKFNLSVQKAKKAIDKGKIGKLLRINRYFLTHPKSDRMLVGNSHWSHKLPGGRWYETLPHELYLTHYFAGWSRLENVSVISTDSALPGAKADEVCFTLNGNNVISNYHYSSNCELNKRYIEIIGSKGVITLDVLSDMIFIDNVKENKLKRGIGILFIESSKRVYKGLLDRLGYFYERIKGVSPHTRIIVQFDKYIDGKIESPTPMEEVDFVVKYCEKVGKEIDRKINTNQ